MMIMRFFSDFLYKGICCGYSFELHRQVDAIQMSTHNICLYKDVKKKYTGCNLKSTEFLDCGLIGVCAVIRSNTVCSFAYIPSASSISSTFLSTETLYLCVIKIEYLIKYSKWWHTIMHVHCYKNFKLQYLSSFFTNLDQICAKTLVSKAEYFNPLYSGDSLKGNW